MLHLCSWGFKDLFGNWKLGACFMAHSHCLLCFFCSLQMGSELCWQKSDQNWDTYPNLWEQMCHDQAMSYSNTSPSLMQHSLTKGQLGASQGSDRENHERKEASLCPAKVRHGKAIASWRTLLDGIPHYVIPYVFGRTRSWVNQVWEGRLIIMLKYIGNSSLRENKDRDRVREGERWHGRGMGVRGVSKLCFLSYGHSLLYTGAEIDGSRSLQSFIISAQPIRPSFTSAMDWKQDTQSTCCLCSYLRSEDSITTRAQ